ncbi:MAG: hypothetical protein HC905_25755 [Bacteroidales bacterium]|nr:hypothetical protein [Bacteroidales bacterium]
MKSFFTENLFSVIREYYALKFPVYSIKLHSLDNLHEKPRSLRGVIRALVAK